MKNTIIVAIVILLSNLAFGKDQIIHDLYENENQITYNHINDFIKANQINSIEQFLSLLPNNYKQHHVLMYNSKSIQGSSFLNPRAILFGKDAKMILSFNGEKTQKGYDNIEMALFDNTKKSYEYREIEFKDNKIGKVSYSTPQKCLACHGIKQTPIWNHYNQWPGAYGSSDDNLSIEEYENVKKYLSHAKNHPRYSQITNLEDGWKLRTDRFINGFSASRTMNQHNRGFTAKLFINIFRGMVKDITELKEFPILKNSIYTILSKCYMTKNNRFQGDGTNAYWGQAKNTVDQILKGKNYFSTSIIRPESLIFYMVEKLGYDTKKWNPNQKDISNPNSLDNGTGQVHETLLSLFIEELNDNNSYFDYREIKSVEEVKIPLTTKNDETCDILAKDADAAHYETFYNYVDENYKEKQKEIRKTNLENFTNMFRFNTKGVPVPSVCLNCHTANKDENGSKIYLPFYELKSMSKNKDTVMAEKMLEYITPDKDNNVVMPIFFQSNEEKSNYFKKDYPKFSRFLKRLIENGKKR